MANKAHWMKLDTDTLLTDDGTSMLSPEAFGAWVRVFCTMHSNAVSELTKSVRMWSRVFGCSPDQAEEIIDELIEAGTGTVERNESGVRMYSKRIQAVLDDQEERRDAAKKRKERWRERNQNADGTRSERVQNASESVLERSGSYSSSLSYSKTEVKDKSNKKKVSIVTESKHLQRYVELTGYNPHVNVQSDVMALAKYPVEEWEAHIQMWIDTPRWNERNVKRLVASFIESQEKENGKETGRATDGKLSARQYGGLGIADKLARMGYADEGAAAGDS